MTTIYTIYGLNPVGVCMKHAQVNGDDELAKHIIRKWESEGLTVNVEEEK